MADKIQKIVEVRFEGNTAHLEKAAKKLQEQYNSAQAAPGGAKADRATKGADRAESKKARTSKQTQAQWAKNSKAKMDKALAAYKLEQKTLDTAKKITKESEKQEKMAKRSKGFWSKDRGGGSKEGPGGLVGMLGGVIGTAIKAATLGVGAMVATHVASGYQAYAQTGKAKAGLLGVTKDVRGYDEAVTTGREQGFTAEETTRQAAMVARRTGNIRDVSFAQKVGRAGVGMDVEAAAGQMGGMRQAGFAGFGQGGAGRKEMQRMIAMGMESGLEAGRMPEFAEGISSLVAKQAGASSGDVSNQGLSALMSKFGQTGMSGFQGARGAAVAQKLDQAVRAPGGGEDGKSFMGRAFGFGVQGGTATFEDSRRRMQQGITGKGGIKNLIDMVNQASKEGGGAGGYQSTYLLELVTKLTADQVDTVKGIVASLNEGFLSSEEADTKLREMTEKAKPIEEQVLEASKTGFMDVVRGVAAVDERLMAIGEGVWKDLHNAQIDLLDITRENLPLVVKAVEAMATAAGVGSDVLTGKGSVANRSSAAATAGGAALDDALSGKVSASFAAKDIANSRKNLERIDKDASSGFGGTTRSATETVVTSVMNDVVTPLLKAGLGLGGFSSSEQSDVFGSGDTLTGSEIREGQIANAKAQELVANQMVQAEKDRAATATMMAEVARLNAEHAKNTNEAIKNLASASTNTPTQPTPGR